MEGINVFMALARWPRPLFSSIPTFLVKMIAFKNNMRLENISVPVIDIVSLDLAPPFSLTRFRGRRQLPQAG